MDVGFGTLGEQLQAKPQELAGGTDVRDVLLDSTSQCFLKHLRSPAEVLCADTGLIVDDLLGLALFPVIAKGVAYMVDVGGD